MKFSYGQGTFTEGDKRFTGQIILGEHKLYLKDAAGDLAQTYIPIEKIERIRQSGTVLEIHARPSLYYRFWARISGEKKHITDLARDIAQRRGLKKQFLKNEWIERGS